MKINFSPTKIYLPFVFLLASCNGSDSPKDKTLIDTVINEAIVAPAESVFSKTTVDTFSKREDKNPSVTNPWDLSDGEIITDYGDYGVGERCKVSYAKDTIYCDSDMPEYYKEYLQSYHAEIQDFASENRDFALIYIDSDTIPELILEGDWVNGQLILSKQKDSIVSLQTWREGFSYIERTGLCGFAYGRQGSFWNQYFKLENGGFRNFIDFIGEDYGYFDESKEGLAKGRLLYNGKRIDCNKLNEILQKEYFDKGNVITTNIIKFKKSNQPAH